MEVDQLFHYKMAAFASCSHFESFDKNKLIGASWEVSIIWAGRYRLIEQYICIASNINFLWPQLSADQSDQAGHSI